MYTAIEGVYENGTFTLNEAPPTQQKTKILVTFLSEPASKTYLKKRNPGSLLRLEALTGKHYDIPDDFNSMIDDLNDYM